jgi:hypothetical protein
MGQSGRGVDLLSNPSMPSAISAWCCYRLRMCWAAPVRLLVTLAQGCRLVAQAAVARGTRCTLILQPGHFREEPVELASCPEHTERSHRPEGWLRELPSEYTNLVATALRVSYSGGRVIQAWPDIGQK